jgi:hypothetical protein
LTRPNVNLYEYLRQKFADDPNVQVVLDRRHGQERKPDGGASVEQRANERRRLAIDQAPRSHGLAVVIPPR